MCLGARRSIAFTDADFHALDEQRPIRVAITLGDLPDSLRDLDAYGLFLRGFDSSTGAIEDEPGRDLEDVLTVQLTVDASLEPMWSLYSARAVAQDQQRSLSWTQRVRMAPTRLGPGTGFHLAWRQGSLLSRLASDLPDISAALADAARDARRSFGDRTGPELRESLASLSDAARQLGIPVGDGLKAMLDAESVSLGRGAVALHTSAGVPLQCLGTGSLRLLVAALQRQVQDGSSIVLVDELEHGLEPHRVIRLLNTLGAKEAEPTAQVFVTTHSPVAVRELPGEAQFVLRRGPGDVHTCTPVGSEDGVQGTIRLYPEALLARTIVVCEGASEVGLLRGLDQYEHDQGRVTFTALGAVAVDAKSDSQVVGRASAFQGLGYKTAILRDNDRGVPAGEETYRATGGTVFCWPGTHALEDALFAALSETAVHKLLDLAVENVGEPTVAAHIATFSGNRCTLADCRGPLTAEHREVLGRAAKSKQGAWFKSVSAMETAARTVVAPHLAAADPSLRDVIERLRAWVASAAS